MPQRSREHVADVSCRRAPIWTGLQIEVRWLLLCKAGWLAGGQGRVASEMLSESWERDDVGRGSSKVIRYH